MGDWLAPIRRAAPGAAKVRVTSPVLARYLDDLRMAEQAKALDMHFGRIPQPAGMFDNIDIPEAVDPVAAERAVGAAPRTWLEGAEMSRAMEPQPAAPLTDMLLDNERRRALISSRLDRLTPEQQARSLPYVGRQYEADRAAARAAGIQRDRNANTALALTAAGGLGAAAFAARMAQERDANRKARDINIAQGVENAVRGIDIDEADGVYVPDVYVGASAEDVPDLFADDTYLPGESADEITLEDQLADDVAAIRVPGSGFYLPRDDQSKALVNQLSRPQEIEVAELFKDDPMVNLSADSPDDAVANAPGPGLSVGRNLDMEDLPGPQLRSIQVLIRAGIPAGRAMDIITRGASMSPDEYRMVTGGRR